jgi:hypothetical protein
MVNKGGAFNFLGNENFCQSSAFASLAFSGLLPVSCKGMEEDTTNKKTTRRRMNIRSFNSRRLRTLKKEEHINSKKKT